MALALGLGLARVEHGARVAQGDARNDPPGHYQAPGTWWSEFSEEMPADLGRLAYIVASKAWSQSTPFDVPALLGVSSLALAWLYELPIADERGARYIVDDAAADRIRDVRGRGLQMPTLFQRPWLVEAQGAPLFERTVGLGGYNFGGRVHLIGIEASGGRPQSCDISWAGDPREGAVLTCRASGARDIVTPRKWLMAARAFAMSFGHMLDAVPQGLGIHVAPPSADAPWRDKRVTSE